MEKRQSFNKGYWNNWISMCKKMNLKTNLVSFTKINLKWITDLNVKCKIIKLLVGIIGENLDDLEFGNDFLDRTPKA